MTTCIRCGKTNLDPEYPHTCTPKAVLLADELERHLGEFETAVRAAAELRRLHEELDKVKQITLRDEALLRRALDSLQASKDYIEGGEPGLIYCLPIIDAIKERLK